jgi:hypothetical protein
MFERNFVHGKFHQMDAASMFRFEVFNRQWIGQRLRVESFSLIADHEVHALAAFAAATDVSQLASLEAIAMEHRVSSLEGGIMLVRLERTDEALRAVQAHLDGYLEAQVRVRSSNQ